MNKLFAAALTTNLLLAQAVHAGNFNPNRPAQAESLFCVGQNPDYPRASIYYDSQSDQFNVTVSYDLDVPGGATGSDTWIAVGSVTSKSILLKAVDGSGNFIQGSWSGGSYATTIGANKFTCSLR